MPMTLIVLANAAATFYMCGVIWFVQLVHYPSFCAVGEGSFPLYHRRHTRRTTLVVAGPMLFELLTAVAMVVRPGRLVPAAAAWAGLALIAVIWTSTFLLQVPEHDRLGRAFDPASHARLCRGNWIRTAAWTGRAVLVGACLAVAV
jgi:hypothetical protein